MLTKPRRAEAAYTKRDASYPGFINVCREDDKFTVTIRGDARDGQCGPLVSLPLSSDEWRSFLAEMSIRL